MTDLSIIAGAGGGCFRRGTQVQLEHGKTIAIEDIKVGDEVLAFDENGDLHLAKVEKLHVHTPQPLLRVQFWRGEIFITPNHWVLNQYSSFVEIQTLSIEDALVDGMGHLRPIINFESIGSEPVYNLTVEKYHTFIANDVRVHNGGHRETYPVVAGAGGGGAAKGGGGRAAREDPESLRSRAMVSILDLLGEGQIGGLLKGAQSIYFNDTPLQNSDGSYNFGGVTWEAKYGLPNQTYISGYSDIETPFNVSTQAKATGPVTFTVTNPNADRVRIIVAIPSLTSTDITTGDLHGTSLEYKFQISTNGGAYQDVVVDYVLGAATVGTSEGSISITGTDPATTNVSGVLRLDATATVSVVDYTWGATAVLQPQTWSGSAWVNYGARITIATDPYADNYVARFSYFFATQSRQILKDVYIDLPAKVGRFVVVSQTAGSVLSLINPKAFTGSSKVVVSGKTRSRYQRSHMLVLPKPGTTWNIRMVRLTPDAGSSAISNDTYLDSYVEIVDAKMAYTNSAIVGVSIDSSLFNKIPTRSYLVDGLYIQIPTNYDPVARLYTGIWNGTFKVAVSNNPAWVLYDLLTNTRYGLGQYIGTDGSKVDKAQLYAIGKYCDQLVSDGFDGTEPRFAINTVIQTQAEAYRLITDICSTFQGMSYWAGGMVGFTQDSPRDPSMIYGRANVIDGMFNYVGSARKDRHSVVHVTWNDPLDGYKQRIEYVEDAELVTKYGIRKTEVVAFGCTSRGQANRVGRWILYTEQYESALITFGVGLDSALVLPGEVIRINDPSRAGKRMAGRIKSITSTSAVLDAPTALVTGAEISFALPDGTFVDRNILQTTGTYTTVTWTTALTTLPLVNSMFILSELTLNPMLARVIGIAQDETNKGQFMMTAVEHNPLKYGAIENGWNLTLPQTSIVKTKPDAPTNLLLTDILYQSGANYASKLHASWDNDNFGDLSGWAVRLLGPSNIWQDFGIMTVASLEIPNVTDGQDYRIEVKAVNIIGIQSDAASASRTILGKDGPPSNVTGASAVENSLGIRLSWINIFDIDLAYYEIRKGTVWATATVIGTVNNNFIDLAPQAAGLHTWLIRAKDTTDHYSLVDGVASLTVGVPATPTVVAAFVGSTVEVGWTAITGADNYYVEIVVASVVKRSFYTPLNSFSYTIELATRDGGPWRSIVVKVKALKDGVLGLAGTITSNTNVAPAAPSLILVSGIGAVSVSVSRCEDLDYAGTVIYASQTVGFTPGPGNLIYEGGTFFLHGEISGTWYYKAAHYDSFGKSGLSYSTQMSALPVESVSGIKTVTGLPANPSAIGGEIAIFLDSATPALRGLYAWTGSAWSNTAALAEGSVVTGTIAAGAVVAGKIAVSNLSAITANMGAITAGSMTVDISGFIRGGQTAYNSGTGFWLGYNSGAYKFSLGNSSGNKLTWDGTALALTGNLILGTTNSISAGMTAYGTGNGFWLGYSGGAYKLSIGDSLPGGKGIYWDGTQLEVRGNIITTGNINANAITQASTAYTGAEMPVNRLAWTSAQYLWFNKTTWNPAIVTFSMYVRIDGGNTRARVVRDGVAIVDVPLGITVSGAAYTESPVLFYFQYNDLGAPGGHSYDLQFYSDALHNTIRFAFAQARSIFAMELKR